MYLLYSVLLGLAVVLAAPWWLVRMLTQGKYRAGLGERLGRVPARLDPAQGCIWVHAVSVGEVLAVSGLVAGLRARFPDRRVLISTTTDTGQKLARERFGKDNVFYYPADFAFAIRPYLRTLQPSLIVLAESEFWPNFLRLARCSGARVAVVNARISDRSLPRYLRLRALWRRVLHDLDIFLAQSEEDARRLVGIGAPMERVRVAGNLKFDVDPPKEVPVVKQIRDAITRGGANPVIVAGSTVEGEEELILEAFGTILRSYPNALLILAPRRPERFNAVAELPSKTYLPTWRRSNTDFSVERVGHGVLVLDSIGELASAYALGTIAFVGGSMVPHGGHNVLEPASLGIPVVVGRFTENFRDVISVFRKAGAIREVLCVWDHDDAVKDLCDAFVDLLRDAPARQELRSRAASVVQQHRGATERVLNALAALLANQPTAEAKLRAETTT
ncbi:MAG TPA: 3-deoxy-D-manno-octulosonic acid transferase [Terriglobales bacterium]|jgi:3-deoxy-D-manno-octulosonic-acid transferase|nr:3-deoxy-D-manno-octulosonic acid transferase [Terriglobales bacterium]